MEQGTREAGGEAADDGGGGGAVAGAGASSSSAAVAGVSPPARQLIRWDWFLHRRSLRVLLVEHDDSTRQVVTALLRKCSYHVAGVADGLKAWEIMQERRFAFDLVLTEVAMPSLSGIGLLTKIVSTEECKNIPVIMMSSQDSIGVVLKCMLIGAADFLVKPVRKNELRNLWQHVWRRHCSTSQASASENNAASNRVSANNVADASKTVQNSDDESDANSSGSKRDMEIESAQNFRENTASSSGEMQEKQEINDRGIIVKSDNLKMDEFCEVNKEKPNLNIISTQKEAEGSTNPITQTKFSLSVQENGEIKGKFCLNSKIGSSQSAEISLSHKTQINGYLNSKDKVLLNRSHTSAFSRYCERRNLPLIQNGYSFDHEANTNTNTNTNSKCKEENPNPNSTPPQLGFIQIPIPLGSIPYGYTTILHPVYYYPSFQPPDHNNPTAQVASDRSKSNSPEQEEEHLEDSRNFQEDTINMSTSCSHQDITARGNGSNNGSGETENGNGMENGNVLGNLESGNESAAQTGGPDRSRREAALIKFRLKRKDRCFEKKVRYYNRKKLAEQRPRVKGQFVSQKASESTTPVTETEN